MGDMFRSEQMALCQMFIQPEAAYASVAELGESGCVQFRDLNSDVNPFQRKFVSEVRRCDELERKIRYIERQLSKDDIKQPEVRDEPRTPNPREIIDLEAQLESIESEIRELSHNEVNLKLNFLGMIELKQVLENTEGFFSDQEVINLDSHRFSDAGDLAGQGQPRGQLGFVAGVVKLERFFAFERMLWRISRGNVFLKRADLDEITVDPETGRDTMKTVFMAFFQGDELKQRIKKVCAGFHASIYPCPSSYTERQEMIRDVRTRLEDLNMVLNQTADHRARVLVAAAKNLPIWSIMAKKMKAIYHTLNLFNMDLSNRCLIGEGWLPINDLPVVRDALARGSTSVDSTITSFLNIIETNEQPPTYTRTNKFTRGFQNLIDAYGIASYREVNPALYTCITFPFLFAVMFGDLGHGIILTLCALWMVLREKQLSHIKEEIFGMFFGGRYIILLMGLFSMYTGFIYNDIFSISMNVFGSGWRINYNTSTVTGNPELTLDPRYATTGVYPVGLDPIWQLASNKIIFLNTYKMKMSIIFGVLHMIFGVFMSLINYVNFRKPMSIILHFVPQMLFLVLLFGYMAFMMFFKFVKYSAKSDLLEETPGCAPSILILFINMMLMKHNEPLEGCKEYMFAIQEELQLGLVIAALLCIPWMLLGNSFYKMATRKVKSAPHNGDISHIGEASDTNGKPVEKPASAASGGHGHDDNESMGEVFIQEAIHTIEYVLSTVSHTASYLRLWALSLAHAQLSEVLWTKLLHMGFLFPGYIGVPVLFVMFSFWAFLTFAILCVIEGLSAFLHTLRLHWVEFMSKFFSGLGYAFQPFSFEVILANNEEE